MVFSRLSFIALLLASSLPAPALAAAEPLAPSSAWTVDYGDEKCSLLRDFGRLDEDGVGLRIDSYGSLSQFRVNLVGKRLAKPRNPVSLIAVTLPPDERARIDVPAVHGTVGDYRFVQFAMNFAPDDRRRLEGGPGRKPTAEQLIAFAAPDTIDPAFEARVDALEVDLQGKDDLRLQTGPMAPALAAMRKCVDDLRASWGLDPKVERSLTRRAYPDPDAVAEVMKDFPMNQLYKGTNGLVPLRIMVGADGKATACVVQQPGTLEAFSKAACGNLGTRFFPALDAEGRPVASYYQNSVFYLSGSM